MMPLRSPVARLGLGLACLLAGLGARAQRVDVEATLRGLLVTDDRAAWAAAERALVYAPVEAFTPEAVRLLGEALTRREVAYFPDLIRVAGAVGDAGTLAGVPEEALADELTRQEVMYARVRQGDEALARELVARIRRVPLDDRYVTRLLPDLIYTRARPVFDHLYGLMMRPTPTCRSPNPNVDRHIDCGYALAAGLGHGTAAFPVVVDPDEWVLEVDDYPAALALVREWYGAHADTYVIDRTAIY